MWQWRGRDVSRLVWASLLTPFWLVLLAAAPCVAHMVLRAAVVELLLDEASQARAQIPGWGGLLGWVGRQRASSSSMQAQLRALTLLQLLCQMQQWPLGRGRTKSFLRELELLGCNKWPAAVTVFGWREAPSCLHGTRAALPRRPNKLPVVVLTHAGMFYPSVLV